MASSQQNRLRMSLPVVVLLLFACQQGGWCQAQKSPGGKAAVKADDDKMSHERLASYDDYELYTKGYSYDDTNDGSLYFNSKTGFMEDIYGDYLFETPQQISSCKLDPKGKPVLDGAYANMCDIQVTGGNKQVPLMPGGIDGVYKLHTCEAARPAFLRQNSPPGEDRLLWYFEKHKDWDISNGTLPAEDDVFLYGGEGGADLRPEFVAKDRWLIASDFQKNVTLTKDDSDYMKANVVLQCTNKRKAVPSPSKSPVAAQREAERPYITDKEWDDQLRSVITPAARERAEASKGVNTGLMAVLAVLGVGMLWCIVRCFLGGRAKRARRGDAKGGWIGMTQIGSSRGVAED